MNKRPSISMPRELQYATNIMKKSMKANKNFYQSNATATSVVSALVLNACVNTLMSLATSSSSSSYNTPTMLLFCVCVSEGLSLFFGNVLLLMPSNLSTLGKNTEWVWQQCFIWMVFFMALGIIMLVSVIGSTGRPSKVSASLLIPLAVLVYCAGSLIYYKLVVVAGTSLQENVDQDPSSSDI